MRIEGGKERKKEVKRREGRRQEGRRQEGRWQDWKKEEDYSSEDRMEEKRKVALLRLRLKLRREDNFEVGKKVEKRIDLK